MQTTPTRWKKQKTIALLLSPMVLIFISSNFVNLGNLLFNLVFSRWLGPEAYADIAFILTVKLSILSVLNALQMQVTEKIAHAAPESIDAHISAYARLNRKVGISLFLLMPIFAYLVWQPIFVDEFNLSSPWLLPIFIIGVPFYLPLSLWRGVAQGRLDLPRMILSANAEMLMRLVGGAVLYWMGLGLEGIVIAFVASLLLAWGFARPPIPATQPLPRKEALPWRGALPWAAIQLAIVLMLDGDVFVAKAVLPGDQAGFIAALSVEQRIVFFGVFALSSVFVPQVIRAIKSGEDGLKQMRGVALLFLLATTPVLLVSAFFPEILVSILFGAEFAAIAPSMLLATLNAALATASYFIVTFAIAHGWRNISYSFLLMALFQLLIFKFFTDPEQGFAAFVRIKFVLQVVFLTIITIFAFIRMQNMRKFEKLDGVQQ